VCIKIQRLIVHSSLYDRFVAAFTAATAALECGDPAREDVVVGPLIERRHVDRVLAWIDEAVASGATKLAGGERRGSIVTPAILEDVPAAAKISCEEVFGPVATLERFDDFGDALERCNRTRYGLQAGIFTRDVSRALRAFRELDYGGVMINEAPAFRLDNFPYGGTKDSGFGREGVRFAVEEMTEPKVLMIRGS
jgi:acyl-CoA reductase-like NAD-dependent aldehyde dehydrogenase